MTDYAGAYRELRERLTELLRGRDEAELETLAPATPAWRVRDIVAHLGGVCDDVRHGNLSGVATDDWTDAQVLKRRDWPFEVVLGDWEDHASAIEPGLNDLGPAIGQMLADASTHEQDVRGALGTPGARDSSALVIGVEWCLDALGGRLAAEGLGTVHVEHEAGSADLGSGEPVTRLRTSRFELARAMTGRRSRAQVAAYDWQGPFDPSELLVSPIFFTPPEADLAE